MTKEMLWLLMGHLVCIGQWAAFIMVDHAFLGRGRRFRFPCLWAACWQQFFWRPRSGMTLAFSMLNL